MTVATEITQTQAVLAAMLTENTGTHFLDSGGAYGRAWQANRAAAGEHPAQFFIDRPDIAVDAHFQSVTLDVFHFLDLNLEFDPEMDARWGDYCTEYDTGRWDLEGMAHFARNWAGVYGDGKAFIVNTYNGEDSLSQIVQYLYGYDPETDRAYVILQIHGGCDARGGYTDGRVFRVLGEGTDIFDNASFEAYCTNGNADNACWQSSTRDGGYSWESYNYPADHDTTLGPVVNDAETAYLCPICGGPVTFQPTPGS